MVWGSIPLAYSQADVPCCCLSNAGFMVVWLMRIGGFVACKNPTPQHSVVGPCANTADRHPLWQ